MIILRGVFGRLTLQLTNIENNTIFFKKILNIKISFVLNSYKICLYHVGCTIFFVQGAKKI